MKKLLALLLVLITLLGTAVVPATAEEEDSIKGFFIDVDAIDDIEFEDEDEDEGYFIPEGLEKAGEAIVGKDNRVKIKNCNKFPYTTMAKMSMYFACCGKTFVGTGTMVSKNKFLTAGHCLYCQDHGKLVTAIDFYFGYNSRKGTSYKEYHGSVAVYVPSQYKTSSEYDFGVVVFPTNLGSTVGYMAPLWQKGNSYYTSRSLYVAGYPGGRNLSYCKGKVKIKDANHIKYEMDTEGGQSGGPVYTTGYRVVAIHHTGVSSRTTGQGLYNIAHRLSKRVRTLYTKAKY